MSRVDVRLVDGHPGTRRHEVARFKGVTRPEAQRLLAAAQVALWGTSGSSMWRCEVHTDSGGWRPMGPRTVRTIRAEVERLTAVWGPYHELASHQPRSLLS